MWRLGKRLDKTRRTPLLQGRTRVGPRDRRTLVPLAEECSCTRLGDVGSLAGRLLGRVAGSRMLEGVKLRRAFGWMARTSSAVIPGWVDW